MRVVAVMCVAAVCLSGQHEKEADKDKHPFIGDRKAIEAGAKLFASGCGACHGSEGQGGRGPNLLERVFWHPLDDKSLFAVIQKGIPGGGMPGANLEENQAWQLVAFVRSLTSPAAENDVSGDARAGEDLFWGNAGCGNCHRVRGRGGMLGPDLSDIGGTRPAAQLKEAIVNPDADGAVGYRAAALKLKNGAVMKGVARNHSNYSLQLQDEKGELHLISMADVAEISLGKGSPMPKDYGKRLTKDQIQNLLAFLARQTVRPVEQAKK